MHAGVDFSGIRYAQCWEDADVLLEGLDVRDGDTCVSVASAGDNTLSLLTLRPKRVVAIDLSAAQIAALELRVAGYRTLEHEQLLQLLGVRPADRTARAALYARVRDQLGPESRAFWDARPALIAAGAATGGKFERYFATFRRRVLPLVHDRRRREALFAPRTPAERVTFYDQVWDNRRWRAMFNLFFSRFVMGRLGRDPRFFRYVDGPVAARLLARTRRALTDLDPCDNPYVQWIVLGRYATALPHALRPENFAAIRANLGRLSWRVTSLDTYLDEIPPGSIDRFNFSDVFEYMSPESANGLYGRVARAARPGARLAYWNMMVPRQRPAHLAHELRPLEELSAALHRKDKAFFYGAFRVEERQ